jgi:hypothetical protein
MKLQHNCGGHLPATRRHFLFGAASMGLLHVSPEAHASSSGRAQVRNTAKHVVFINMNGAPSQMDTFDPKDGPWNPADIDIRDYTGGIRLSRRLFPNLSRQAGDLLVMRSCASWEAAHERGQFYMQTAHSQNPALAAETPHIGSVIAREKVNDGLIPPFLSFNQSGLQGATFLGGRFMPFMPPAARTGISTLSHNHFNTADLGRARFEQRFAMLRDLDEPLRTKPFNEAVAAYAGFYDRARSMMYNAEVENVFRFGSDDETRYGNTGIGRSLIVVRNAIRANNGAVFFNVTQGGWDTHVGMFDMAMGGNNYQLSNELDRAVGSLVDDLKSSGQFNSTLIVMMGEFGRTPGVLNSRSGRDHYRDVMSVAMMGGGTRGGKVIGATNADCSKITDFGWSERRPIYVEDVTATIYSALGIDWTRRIMDTPSGRAFYYLNNVEERGFRPVEEVFA